MVLFFFCFHSIRHHAGGRTGCVKEFVDWLYLRQGLATLHNYTGRRSHAYCKSVNMGSPFIIFTFSGLPESFLDRNIKLDKVSPTPAINLCPNFTAQERNGLEVNFVLINF
jgi:hypothetical protein